MPAIIAILAGWVGQLLTASVARYIAMRLVLFTLTVGILPIVLKGLMYWFVQGAIGLVTGQVSGSGLQSQTLSYGGMAGWIASQLRMADALSLIMGGLAFRFSLRLIPFIH